MSAPNTPMPRRQSCDRCHNQKVRCFTDGPDEIFTPGGAADDAVHSNGHFISSFPCRRCRKAGALCIFSPQLRSGRPRLARNASSQPGYRKRASLSTTPSSSCPPLSPTRSLSTSPLPISTPYVGMLGLGNAGYRNSTPANHEVASLAITQQLDDTTLPAAMMTPVSHLGTEDHGNMGNFGPWLTLPFNSNTISAMPYSTTQYYPASSTADAPCAANYDPLLFATTSTAHCSAAPPTTTNLSWEHHSNPSEDYHQELAEIHKRAYRTARTVFSVAASLAPPPVNEIFEVTCSLVSLVERYATSRRSEFDGCHSAFIGTQAGDETMEISFALMAMACHQIILGVFQEVLTAFVDDVQRADHHSYGKSPSARAFDMMPITQISMTAKFISHLLDQLDQSAASLAGMLILSTTLPPKQAPDSPSSPPFSDSSDEFETGVDLCEQRGAVALVFRQVEQRKSRLRTLVHTVRHLVEHFAVL